MSVESSIPCLCKSVKTFGRTPVSVPQVRGENCDIRLTRPYYKREGSLFITSELGDFACSGLYRTNSCKSCKIHDLASGFLAQPGVQKFRIIKFKEN